MTIKHLLFSFSFLIFGTSNMAAQNKPAYLLYNAKGKKISYKKMLKKLKKADIILFGEIHNNPISHWLQLETATDLSKEKSLIIGAEMFERDNQEGLNQYLKEEIDRKELNTLVRLWSNYKTDYEPLIEWAKDKKIPLVATNIPRRYARIVFREGFEGLTKLSPEEKNWMTPLPILYNPELPGYKNMLTMMGDAHTGANFPKAQAIKDATMAHSILEYYEAGKLFFHINGAYHSDNYEGILWYLQQKQPKLGYQTITTVSQKDITSLMEENKGKADFIICVPSTMTTTY